MADPIPAILLLTGLCLGFGVLLALAHRYLSVAVDPRQQQVEALLGGSNCGACGKPGCQAFAEALLSGSAQPGQCTVITPAAVAQLAALTGLSGSVPDKRVARLHCGGGRSAVRLQARYTGEPNCASAFRNQRGGRSCAYGCLGFGDCERACTFDAITMNDEALPVVDMDTCTACGDCVGACPAALFSLQPVSEPVVVQCSSPLTGDAARASCAVACDACGRCVQDAPPAAMALQDGLPRVLQPQQVGEAVTFRCPTGAIAAVADVQFAYDVPLSALRRHLG